jgi:hypothetical protein
MPVMINSNQVQKDQCSVILMSCVLFVDDLERIISSFLLHIFLILKSLVFLC